MPLALAWTQYRRPMPEPPGAARAVLRFRDGGHLAVDVDAENGGYLGDCFRRPNRRRFAWFETMDGFLVGADLAALAAIDWLPAAAAAPEPARLDRDRLVLRFSDGRALHLGQIAADDIDRLRGAAISARAGSPLQLAEGAAGQPASIPVERLVLATLPAAWMDAEQA